MADERKGAWLSPESYERLRSELEEMTTTGRAEIARKSSRRWRAVSPS